MNEKNPNTVNGKLKLWQKIIISVIILLVTFVLGIVIGSLVQIIVNINNEANNPNHECATCAKIDEDVTERTEIYNENEDLKPMVYLYPTEETEVSVRLGKPKLLTTTYPRYNDGWTVFAEPDGTLRDDSGREFYGLYWEGAEKYTRVKDDGFVVPREDSARFLEEKLAILGLTQREANEFIIYWLPKLEASSYNYISFETKDEIESYMPLMVSPKPDSVIRVSMSYKPLNEPIEVTEQQLTAPTRTGFTVVEWGGTKIGEEFLK